MTDQTDQIGHMKIVDHAELIRAAMTDPELAGSKENWEHTVEHCALAARHFNAGPFLMALQEIHYHIHPEVIRFLHRIGKTLCPICNGLPVKVKAEA